MRRWNMCQGVRHPRYMYSPNHRKTWYTLLAYILTEISQSLAIEIQRDVVKIKMAADTKSPLLVDATLERHFMHT